MDIEQLAKRLEWLDEERRKDKTTIVMLEEKILSLEGLANAASRQVSELNGDVDSTFHYRCSF